MDLVSFLSSLAKEMPLLLSSRDAYIEKKKAFDGKVIQAPESHGILREEVCIPLYFSDK